MNEPNHVEESKLPKGRDYRAMSLEESADLLYKSVYQSALLFERFEDAGHYYLSGKESAKEIADDAVQLLRLYWKNEKATDELSLF